jgi:nitrate/nitrite transport system permease protein
MISGIFVISSARCGRLLINTAFGVASVRRDLAECRQDAGSEAVRKAFTVILPAAAPTILTARAHLHRYRLAGNRRRRDAGGRHRDWLLRLERVEQLNLTNVIFAILVIGVVGMLLDFLIGQASTGLSLTSNEFPPGTRTGKGAIPAPRFSKA